MTLLASALDFIAIVVSPRIVRFDGFIQRVAQANHFAQRQIDVLKVGVDKQAIGSRIAITEKMDVAISVCSRVASVSSALAFFVHWHKAEQMMTATHKYLLAEYSAC